MRKVFVLAATVAALASCAKNEVLLVKSSNDEITFNVAPKTKALESNQSDFGHKLKFKSYAYYFESETATPELYINNEEIYYQKPDGAQDSVWRAKNSYYWPKKEGSSLTFYAWTSLKETVSVGTDKAISKSYMTDYVSSGVSCTAEDGIKAENYDLEVSKNVDFLVADKAEKQTKNVETYKHNGVPTLFKHKLSYVVFTVKTDKDYSTSSAGRKKFTLKSIKFDKINTKGNYTQSSEAWEANGDASVQTYCSAETTIAKDVTTLTSDNTVNYYLPQEFGSTQFIEVVYEIETPVNGQDKPFTETVTRKLYLNSADAVKPFADAKWEIGKKYTVNLTFSLDEITWDPAVEDWDNTNSSAITIS